MLIWTNSDITVQFAIKDIRTIIIFLILLNTLLKLYKLTFLIFYIYLLEIDYKVLTLHADLDKL